MPSESGLRTRISLLVRLKDTRDEAAWREFVALYQPAIQRWCRQAGLQDADAGDVTQQVLVQLCRAMANFEYDRTRGTFRGWLFTVTRHAWQAWRKSQARHAGSGDSEIHQRLHNVAAREDLMARVGEAYDLEVLAEARERVRGEFTAKSFAAFELMKVQGLTGREAAERLQINTDAAFQACSRVMRRITAVIREIEAEAVPVPREARDMP